MVHLCEACTPKDHKKDFDKTIWSHCEFCGQIADCEIIDPEEETDEEKLQRELRCTD